MIYTFRRVCELYSSLYTRYISNLPTVFRALRRRLLEDDTFHFERIAIERVSQMTLFGLKLRKYVNKK